MEVVQEEVCEDVTEEKCVNFEVLYRFGEVRLKSLLYITFQMTLSSSS